MVKGLNLYDAAVAAARVSEGKHEVANIPNHIPIVTIAVIIRARRSSLGHLESEKNDSLGSSNILQN